LRPADVGIQAACLVTGGMEKVLCIFLGGFSHHCGHQLLEASAVLRSTRSRGRHQEFQIWIRRSAIFLSPVFPLPGPAAALLGCMAGSTP
jgi:hypothetical protein